MKLARGSGESSARLLSSASESSGSTPCGAGAFWRLQTFQNQSASCVDTNAEYLGANIILNSVSLPSRYAEGDVSSSKKQWEHLDAASTDSGKSMHRTTLTRAQKPSIVSLESLTSWRPVDQWCDDYKGVVIWHLLGTDVRGVLGSRRLDIQLRKSCTYRVRQGVARGDLLNQPSFSACLGSIET